MSIEEVVLRRDDGRCFRCGKPVSDYWPGKSCHHRQLRSARGSDTPENRITLCGSGTTGCHGWVHAHPEAARADGWLVSRYDRPEDVPVLHWQFGSVFLMADGGAFLLPAAYAERKAAEGGDDDDAAAGA